MLKIHIKEKSLYPKSDGYWLRFDPKYNLYEIDGMRVRESDQQITAQTSPSEATIAALLHDYDWAQTPLGAIETWSDSLRAAVQDRLSETISIIQEPSATVALRQVAQIDAFRVRLSDALRSITDASEIQAIAARILGESLGATRVIYLEVVSNGEEVIVHRNYVDGVAELSGRYRLEDYSRNLSIDHREGRTQVVTDIPNSNHYTEEEKARYQEIDIAAHIDVPLLKEGQFIALLAVHQFTPRQWTAAEIKQVEETAERTWAAVERAQAEAALRQSESRFRRIFECNMIPMGTFTSTGGVVDANDALLNLIGYTRSELEAGQINWQALTPAEYAALDQNALTEIAAQGVSASYEKIYLHKDGSAIPILIGAASFTNESDRGFFFVIDLTEHKQVEEALRDREAQLAQEALALIRLNESGTRLWRKLSLNEGLNEMLGATLELMGAEMGNVRLLDPDRGVLHIAAQQGFQQDFLDYFREVSIQDDSACGSALRFGDRTVIEDVETDVFFMPFRPVARAAGFRAVQSTPLIGRDGTPLGVLSTHWRSPHSPSEAELRRLDLYVRQAADFIEHVRAEAIAAADLESTRLLRDLSARLIPEDNIQVLYDEIVAAAIKLTQADAGTVQILDPATEDLLLLASHGFDSTITNHFARVNASSNTSCGAALTTGTRAFVDFDPPSNDPSGSFQMHLDAGYHSAQSTPLISRSGKPIGMVSTHWSQHHRPSDRELRLLDLLVRQAADLIEQRKTKAELRKSVVQEQAAREQAETANRIKDEFLAVLSHELRSPLNPILGWTKLLQQKNFDATQTKAALMTIERNAQLQAQLIDDLLDISRILRGKLSLNQTLVDLRSVVIDALETVRLAAEAKSLQVETSLPCEISAVLGDAGRLQQVIWNLLSNAVKFTPPQGRIAIALTQTATHIQIQVQDTGKGIAPDFLPYVFEHFRQEDGAITRKFGGLGLGLAIARQIVELHGGTIAVESQGEDQGTTFTVQLPRSTIAPPSVPVAPFVSSLENLTGVPILVVDDESDSREITAFVLEQAGAIVTCAASGREALIALEQAVPTVIVSDIGMPEMDGYTFLKQMRTLESARHLPAIALTAYASEFDRQQAQQAGFQLHLSKPINPDELIQAIATLIKL